MGNQKSVTKERYELLEKKVSDVLDIHGQSVHCVRDTDTLDVVLQELNKYNISSCPVQSVEHKIVIGYIDVNDILAFILGEYEKNGYDFLINPVTFQTTKASQICDISGQDPLIIIQKDSSLRDAVQKLVTSKSHRIVLGDDKRSDLCGIITQSAIINVLSKHLDILHDNPDKVYMEFKKLGNKNVLCVEQNTRTIEAYKMMRQHGFSIIGIVDGHGNLVSCLSATHLRAINMKNFSELFLPVNLFLSFREQEAKLLRNDTRPFLLCASSDATLRNIMTNLSETQYHHIFIIGAGSNEAIGIISLYDILREVIYSSSQEDRKQQAGTVKKSKQNKMRDSDNFNSSLRAPRKLRRDKQGYLP